MRMVRPESCVGSWAAVSRGSEIIVVVVVVAVVVVVVAMCVWMVVWTEGKEFVLKGRRFGSSCVVNSPGVWRRRDQ